MAFKRLDPQDLVISTDSVTSTVWSNNNPTLTGFFTSSTQVTSNITQFYYSVYQTSSTGASAAVQFDIAYCDKAGSGSTWYNQLVPGVSPTRTNYGQYRTLILGDENADFVFGNITSSYFYAINIERARYKQSLLPGTMTMFLSGSGGRISLTDDSTIASSVTYTDAGRVYNMVSGSAGTVFTGTGSLGRGWTPSSGSYGWFLPDIGVILLNGVALDGAGVAGGIALSSSRASNINTANNPAKIVDALNRAVNTTTNPPQGFTMNSQEALSSDFIFIRARNNEFNYSENPSFISGSTGEVIFDSFINNPQTYISTVGLYNDNSELLAVAKLSRPLPKDFTKELLVRVKLDF
jgi:hypothetical protein